MIRAQDRQDSPTAADSRQQDAQQDSTATAPRISRQPTSGESTSQTAPTTGKPRSSTGTAPRQIPAQSPDGERKSRRTAARNQSGAELKQISRQTARTPDILPCFHPFPPVPPEEVGQIAQKKRQKEGRLSTRRNFRDL